MKCNLGRDGAVNLLSQWITEALNPSVNYKGVCRAAPGFARVCPKIIYIILNEKKIYFSNQKVFIHLLGYLSFLSFRILHCIVRDMCFNVLKPDHAGIFWKKPAKILYRDLSYRRRFG